MCLCQLARIPPEGLCVIGDKTDPTDSVFVGRAPEEQETTEDKPLALPEDNEPLAPPGSATPFPQPFPVVVLRFTSLDARTVAMREFPPSEYPHPDLQTPDLMPPNSPVQIELEVMNPGPEAVNYEVSFRAL